MGPPNILNQTRSLITPLKIKFGPLLLLNTFIHATILLPKKNLSTIFHGAGYCDLDLSNDKGAHHISLCARSDSMV